MPDFKSADEAGEYGLGILRGRHREVDTGTPEAAQIVRDAIGTRDLGQMSREDVEELADDVAKKWKEKFSFGSALTSWQREHGF